MVKGHLTTRRDAFTRAGAQPIRELPHLKHGQRVKIGSLIVARQHPPTAEGFCALAVEDPDGMVNVVVPPDVYEECRQAIHSAFVIVDGGSGARGLNRYLYGKFFSFDDSTGMHDTSGRDCSVLGE